MEISRLNKVLIIDFCAHELHKNKNLDGSSTFRVLDDLADLSKSYGEEDRNTRLIILRNPNSLEDIKKLMNIEIIQKSDLEHSNIFWNLFERAIKIGVEKLSNEELVGLREFLFAKI